MSDKLPRKHPAKLRIPAAQRETVMDMVAHRIESLVRSGQLGRGSRLPPEPRLAEMLSVSRASLREALKGMMFLGLLKARPGDGTYLQPSLSSMVSRHFQWMLLLQEIKYFELYELRQILEPAAAALAARRATREDHEQMRAALAAMRAATHDPVLFVRAEMEFHGAITQASKNAAIQSTMRMMYGALAEGRHRVLPLVESLARHCAHHERIYKLIASGEAGPARRAIAADLKYAESLLRKDLKAAERTGAASEMATRMPQALAWAPRQRITRKPIRTGEAKKRGRPRRSGS
jgi:GntR family transcriptional regulator, transcriptional repressor for pyruvate dehydrogenase complex